MAVLVKDELRKRDFFENPLTTHRGEIDRPRRAWQKGAARKSRAQ